MASSIVVTDRESLEQNFVENGVNVFCNAAFGAGAYAIGSTLLGAPPLTIPAALLTTGALLGAMAVCPSRPTQEGIFGKPPPAPGGQCRDDYFVNAVVDYYVSGSQTTHLDFSNGYYPGPLTTTNNLKDGPLQSTDNTSRLTVVDRLGRTVRDFTAPNGIVPGSLLFSYTRGNQGAPDNCGDQPNSGSQIINNTTTGDTIDNSKVTNNQNYFVTIPVLFNFGGVNGTLNLNFGGLKINSLFPLNFDIDIGNVRFRIGEEPDGSKKLKPVNPDKTLPSTDLEKEVRDLQKLIQDIKDCVCTPDIELDALFMPFVDSSVDCQVETATLLVPKGSVSASQYQKFQDTAALAAEQCNQNNVVQLPEELIYSATTTSNGHELFTGEISEEVISLRIKITGVDNPDLPIISLYPEANQRKFGSVSYVLSDMSGGGDYVYVFDIDTYLPLPKRAKKGKLRILFKSGISFEVYDTGERV